MPSPVASTLACRLPSTESYFSRCASVAAFVRSLTATKSMSLSPSAARMMLRPMRPNPLMPTFTAIRCSSECPGRKQSDRTRPRIVSRRRLTDRDHVDTVRIALHVSRSTACSRLLVLRWSPRRIFLYQAIRYKKYVGSLRQRLGYLPIVVQRRRRRVDLDSRRLGGRGADGARARRRSASARYPRLRLFLSTTTMAGQQVARRSLPARRRGLLLSRSTGRSSSAARCDS